MIAYNFIDGQLSKNAHAKIESWEIWDTFILVGPTTLSIQDFQEVSEIGYSQLIFHRGPDHLFQL